jgi:hypothetical protein
MMLRPSGGVLAILCLFSFPPGFAQTGLPPRAPETQDAHSATVTCRGAAVYSAGSGPEVHVARMGTLDQRNPLAPLTNAPPSKVIEVRIRGKLAAAYGPTFHELRRAGPPGDLERELGNAIQWEPNLATLPRELMIVGDEQAELVAKLRFVKCSAAPNARPARQSGKPNANGARTPAAKPSESVPRGTLE